MNVVTSIKPSTVEISSIPSDLFIDGAWRASSSGKRINVWNPSNEELLATIADATVEDGIAAVDAAANAARTWSTTAPRRRAEILLKAYYLMMEKADWLAELISLENGKALADARGRSELRSGILPLVRRGSRSHQWRYFHRARRVPTVSLYSISRSRIDFDYAMEFSRGDGDTKNRTCARRRLHMRPEAGDRNPTHRFPRWSTS